MKLTDRILRLVLREELTPRNRPPRLTVLLSYALLIAFGVMFLYPFLWMLASSLRSNEEIARASMNLLPENWRFENYRTALQTFPFWVYLRNSLITSLIPVVAVTFSSSLVAFAFARIRVPGRNILFLIVLSTLFLPSQVTIIPQFIIFRNLGMVNTLYPLFLGTFFGSAFWIFLLRQFYAGLPKSIEEAARIEGASMFQIWWHIFLPLSRPALIAVAVLTFMGSWNNFFGALVYLHSDHWKTLPLGLAGFSGQYFTQTNLLMAANLVVIAPMIVLFFFSQRSFIEGITFTGSKG